MPFELIILAAGVGSRFGGDKQVEGFGPNGETLLELNVFDALRAGVDSVVWVTRADLIPAIQQIAHRLPEGIRSRIQIQGESLDRTDSASLKRSRPWGTAHAWRAADSTDVPTLVVNADDLYGADAIQAVAQAVLQPTPSGGPDRLCAWVAGYAVSQTLSAHGGVSRARIDLEPDRPTDAPFSRIRHLEELVDVRRGPNGVITGTGSTGAITPVEDDVRVSMNLWGFRGPWSSALARALDGFKDRAGDQPGVEFRIPDVVFEEVSNGGADAFMIPVESRWVGVTFPEDRDRVQAALLEEFDSGTYPSPLYPPS